MTDTSTSPKPPTFAGIEAAIEDPAEITRSTDKAPHTSDQVPSIASLSSSPLSTSNESSNNKKKAAEDQPPSMSTSTSNSAGPLTHTLANVRDTFLLACLGAASHSSEMGPDFPIFLTHATLNGSCFSRRQSHQHCAKSCWPMECMTMRTKIGACSWTYYAQRAPRIRCV